MLYQNIIMLSNGIQIYIGINSTILFPDRILSCGNIKLNHLDFRRQFIFVLISIIQDYNLM